MRTMCEVVIYSVQVYRLTNKGLDSRHTSEVPQQETESIILSRTQCVLVLQQQLKTDQDTDAIRASCRMTFLYNTYHTKNVRIKKIKKIKQPYLVRVNELADGDVDNRFVEDHHFRIFIDVEAFLRLGNVAHHFQELPVKQIWHAPVTKVSKFLLFFQ